MSSKKLIVLSLDDIENYSKKPEGLKFLSRWVQEAKVHLTEYKNSLMELHSKALQMDEEILKKSIFDEKRKNLETLRKDVENKINFIKESKNDLQEKINYVEKILKERDKKIFENLNFVRNDTLNYSYAKIFEILLLIFIFPLFVLMLNYYRILHNANSMITGEFLIQGIFSPKANYLFITLVLSILIFISIIITWRK